MLKNSVILVKFHWKIKSVEDSTIMSQTQYFPFDGI